MKPTAIEADQVELKPLLGCRTGKILTYHKRERSKIVESDTTVPITTQHPSKCLSLEHEAAISCGDKEYELELKPLLGCRGGKILTYHKRKHPSKCLSLEHEAAISCGDKEYGKMIERAVEAELELKPLLGCRSGKILTYHKRKRSDITSQHPSKCLSLEHEAAISCGGVCIPEGKNVKYKPLMTDQIVAESVVHLDVEFQSEGLPKTGNSERKCGSKVVQLECRRHIESDLSNPEDRGGFSKVEGITCSKEKTSLCAHSLAHKNPVGVQMDSKKKENTSSSKLENEDPHLLVVRKDTPSHLSLENPICSPPKKKKLLVLDINGLLVDIVSCPDKRYKHDIMISGKAVFKRPFCEEFLQFCLDRFHVGVWSSRLMKNLHPAISYLMGELKFKLLFYWDQNLCTRTGFKTIENSDKPLFLKELKKLWEKLESELPFKKGEYDETNTLLVDDSPYKALRNPKNTSIFPYTYKYTDISDTSLGPNGDIRLYLEGVSLANNVQDYVASHPFGQPPISESDPSWSFYRQIVEGHA